MKFEEAYGLNKQGEWRCAWCEYSTPHKGKAIRHAWSKHGWEIEIEPVQVGYPAPELSPYDNAIVVEYTGDGFEVVRVELTPEENAQEVVYFGDGLNSEQREALADLEDIEEAQ